MELARSPNPLPVLTATRQTKSIGRWDRVTLWVDATATRFQSRVRAGLGASLVLDHPEPVVGCACPDDLDLALQ
jgi:hypothetical protein